MRWPFEEKLEKKRKVGLHGSEFAFGRCTASLAGDGSRLGMTARQLLPQQGATHSVISFSLSFSLIALLFSSSSSFHLSVSRLSAGLFSRSIFGAPVLSQRVVTAPDLQELRTSTWSRTFRWHRLLQKGEDTWPPAASWVSCLWLQDLTGFM